MEEKDPNLQDSPNEHGEREDAEQTPQEILPREAQSVERSEPIEEFDPPNAFTPEENEPPVTVRMRGGLPLTLKKLLLPTVAAVLLVAVTAAAIFAVRSRGNGAGDESTADSTADAESTGGETTGDDPLYAFDPSTVPEGEIGYRPMDLAWDKATVENKTEHTPDIDALKTGFASCAPFVSENGAPLVLIVHTHTTEGYRAEGALSYDGEGELSRTQNADESVIAVGRVLAETLRNAGIPTVHAEVFHDVKDGTVTSVGSYDRAAATVAEYLAQYPSIRCVIDLHRDVVFDEDGHLVRAVAKRDGEAVAQVRASVGTKENDAWEESFALALLLSEALCDDGASVARMPLLSDAALLGNAAELVLTLDVGTAANTLAESQRAAALVGEALAGVLK